jgi:hypothetical protein
MRFCQCERSTKRESKRRKESAGTNNSAKKAIQRGNSRGKSYRTCPSFAYHILFGDKDQRRVLPDLNETTKRCK